MDFVSYIVRETMTPGEPTLRIPAFPIAVLFAVLTLAVPGDDEASEVVHCEGGFVLVIGRGGVHLEVVADGVARCIERAREDAESVAVGRAAAVR